MRKARWLSAAVLLILFLGACTQKRVNEAEIGVRYGHGPIEGDHFEKIVEPGGYEWVGDDSVYKLPARQVTWTTSGKGDSANSDAPALEFKAQGGETMIMELSTRFVLNTTLDDNQEPFKTFFTSICQKYDCWEGAIGGDSRDDGWFRMLTDIVGNPQQAAANRVGREFVADELRYNNSIADQFADRFAEEFGRLLADEVGVEDIFCGPSYERGDKDCPPVAVNVTSVRFSDPEREGIREARRLAEEKEQLAVAEEAAAIAQQRVNAAKATPEYETLQRAAAMLECAKNPECQLTIVVDASGNTVGVSVPAN